MPKSQTVRPAVESLESLMLMTAAPGRLHAMVMPAAEVATQATPAIALHGTIRGTGTLVGSTLTVHAAGQLGKVGLATITASGSITDPPASITLATRRGKLVLTAVTPAVIAGTSGSVHYTITGGTGAYAHATGSGTIAGSYSVLAHNRITLVAHFS